MGDGRARAIQCTEVWGGIGACNVSVQLAGARGECWSRPHAGSEEGGDIHFLSVCGMSRLTKVVLADVSGHGRETATVSAVIHDALAETIGAHDNTSMLEDVNEAFLERRSGKFRFTTMVSLIFDSEDRSLVYAYAGHPSVLRGRRETGAFETLRPGGAGPDTGLPLGVLPGSEYHQHSTALDRGDVLVVYTDAFSEAPGADGGMLGEAGLARLLEETGSLEPWRLKEHVLDAVGDRLDDDASLVILEVL